MRALKGCPISQGEMSIIIPPESVLRGKGFSWRLGIGVKLENVIVALWITCYSEFDVTSVSRMGANCLQTYSWFPFDPNRNKRADQRKGNRGRQRQLSLRSDVTRELRFRYERWMEWGNLGPQWVTHSKKEWVHSSTVPWLNFSWSINSIMLIWDALHVPCCSQSTQEPGDEPRHRGWGDEFIRWMRSSNVEPAGHSSSCEVTSGPAAAWKHNTCPVSDHFDVFKEYTLQWRFISLFLFVFSFASALMGPRLFCAR